MHLKKKRCDNLLISMWPCDVWEPDVKSGLRSVNYGLSLICCGLWTRLCGAGRACVQWQLPLDTPRHGHVSKSGHVSAIQWVQWQLPLDTGRTCAVLYALRSLVLSTLSLCSVLHFRIQCDIFNAFYWSIKILIFFL